MNTLRIIKETLTCFWFWFPILFFVYSLFQLYLMFFISPLTLIILPVIIILYKGYLEDKQYTLLKKHYSPRDLDKIFNDYLDSLEDN